MMTRPSAKAPGGRDRRPLLPRVLKGRRLVEGIEIITAPEGDGACVEFRVHESLTGGAKTKQQFRVYLKPLDSLQCTVRMF